MHSSSQFTRSAFWMEFVCVGTIIFGENFMVRGAVFLEGNYRWGQSFGVRFSSGEIILGGNSPGGNHPWGNNPGSNYQGVNFP